MTHQLRSAEQRLARWVTYGILAAPLLAILSRDLRLGAITPWIIYASIAVTRRLIISQKFWMCAGYTPPHGTEALAVRQSLLTPPLKTRGGLSFLDQLSQLLASVEHAGLHGGGRDVEDQRAVLD
jgi:hypothetical protein